MLAIKKGMTSLFVGQQHVACTVLQLDHCQVVANKTFESNGYWAVQVGLGERRPKTIPAAMLGYFEAKGVSPKGMLAEFKVRSEEGLLPVGMQIHPDWFKKRQYVDVRADTRGMGFAGGMKRWGFKGQPASHGNSLNHRTMGSSGPSQGGGSRVHPGKKMPGNMGDKQHTVQNLKIMGVNNELGYVMVSGPVPGPKGCVVKLQDAVKRLPPGSGHRNKAVKDAKQRSGDLEERLEMARKLHLELKEARHVKDEQPEYRKIVQKAM